MRARKTRVGWAGCAQHAWSSGSPGCGGRPRGGAATPPWPRCWNWTPPPARDLVRYPPWPMGAPCMLATRGGPSCCGTHTPQRGLARVANKKLSPEFYRICGSKFLYFPFVRNNSDVSCWTCCCGHATGEKRWRCRWLARPLRCLPSQPSTAWCAARAVASRPSLTAGSGRARPGLPDGCGSGARTGMAGCCWPTGFGRSGAAVIVTSCRLRRYPPDPHPVRDRRGCRPQPSGSFDHGPVTRLEQVTPSSPSTPAGGAALPVHHPETDQAEQSAAQARPGPRHRCADDQHGQRPYEPADGPGANDRAWVSKAAGQGSNEGRWHVLHASGCALAAHSHRHS